MRAPARRAHCWATSVISRTRGGVSAPKWCNSGPAPMACRFLRCVPAFTFTLFRSSMPPHAFISIDLASDLAQTSARAGSNVEAAFMSVCEVAVDIKLERENAYRSSLTPSNQIPQSPVEIAASRAAAERDKALGDDSDAPAKPVSPPSIRLTEPPPSNGTPSSSIAKSCAC